MLEIADCRNLANSTNRLSSMSAALSEGTRDSSVVVEEELFTPVVTNYWSTVE